MQPYERLDAWRLCHALVMAIYRASAPWPTAERYALTAQIRRAALSAAANIVEGSARRGAGLFRQFLDVANGSLAEVGYLIRAATELGYADKATATALETARSDAARATWALYRALKADGRTAGRTDKRTDG